MVSHTWGNVFLDTVAACVAAAQGKNYFFHIRPRLLSVERVQELMREMGPTAMETTFWICAMSVNQHTVSCDKSPWPCPCALAKVTHGTGSEVGAFHLMMQWLGQAVHGFTQVIAVDEGSE